MSFKDKVFGMFQARIASGLNVEAATSFSTSNFPELSDREFYAERDYLALCGYIRKKNLRSFVLSDNALEELGYYE